MKADHQHEIESTRIGGFGSSDAAMFLKIGRSGLSSLSNTDKKRIGIAKGISSYKSIKVSDAMQKGHSFEDWYDINFGKNIEREKYIEKAIAKNFKTFAHADFYDYRANAVIELKCVGNTSSAADTYKAQLQWYFLLGISKVKLVIADSAIDFNDSLLIESDTEPDYNIIDTMLEGIRLLDDNWNTIDLSISDDVYTSELLPHEQSDIIALSNYLTTIKQMEASVELMKSKVLDFMEANNIKSLISESYSITHIPESVTTTLDKKRLFSEHPEIKEADYNKTSKKKSYIKVTLK